MRLALPLLALSCACEVQAPPDCWNRGYASVHADNRAQCPNGGDVDGVEQDVANRLQRSRRALMDGVIVYYRDTQKVTCPGCGRGCAHLESSTVEVAARHADHLAILKHELMHLSLARVTGDADYEHAGAMWEGI